jgi:hypothetical protein
MLDRNRRSNWFADASWHYKHDHPSRRKRFDDEPFIDTCRFAFKSSDAANLYDSASYLLICNRGFFGLCTKSHSGRIGDTDLAGSVASDSDAAQDCLCSPTALPIFREAGSPSWNGAISHPI